MARFPQPPTRVSKRSARAFQDLLAANYRLRDLRCLVEAMHKAGLEATALNAHSFLEAIVSPPAPSTPARFIPPPLEGDDGEDVGGEPRAPLPGDPPPYRSPR